ncbi:MULTISPECIES: nuclear transport factor 2 family protein [unclassified Duganella]|uniref:nuclear transport factor 2 family protein n=1 Tax=unclassified Duganella TaxID=2636909 RepID=UPI0006F3D8E8|nr:MULTISPECIES: nuclear transport factor 2 family protein [unclassified Duganella]KQV43115.1 polyketide cyclase [Duganella sp. Root336D2]KRB97241.1 polyketide cyclase [Duganella sp. Root198D2]
MQLQPAVAESLERWHDMIAGGNLSTLPSIVDADAVFRSPIANKPYASRQAVVLVLNTAYQVFENFAYHRQLAADDGLSVVLEFSANVGDKQLKGIDFIRFNEAGKIVDFEVMVRPLSGLQALGEAMGARIGAQVGAFKVPA